MGDRCQATRLRTSRVAHELRPGQHLAICNLYFEQRSRFHPKWTLRDEPVGIIYDYHRRKYCLARSDIREPAEYVFYTRRQAQDAAGYIHPACANVRLTR